MSAADRGGQDRPRRRGRADRTRRDLVAAALALFAEKGVEAASVEEITAAAGVAKGTFYVHFHRKHDVLLEHAATLVGAVGDAVEAEGARAAIDAICERLAEAFASAPRAVRGAMIRELLCNPARWARVAGESRTLTGVIAPLLTHGQGAGEIRDDQPAGELARRLAVLLLDAVSAAPRPTEQGALAERLRSAAAVFLDGAAARAAR